MKRNLKKSASQTIDATDSKNGKVKDFLFDEKHWAIRYLKADPGSLFPFQKKQFQMRRKMFAYSFFILIVFSGMISGCSSHSSKNTSTTDVSGFEALPEEPPIPKDNPMTPAKIELGKQLYFDMRLSVNGTVSCNSCHNAMSSGTTNLPVAIGVYGQKDGSRNDPTVWNAAFKTAQFWDGRAPSLEEQAKGPILNPVEMGMPNSKMLVNRIKAIKGYNTEFQDVFGKNDPVTFDDIVKAIATYERTLITPNGPFDRYLKGDKDAISASAIKGMMLVKDRGCTACHSGPNFSGPTEPMGQGDYKKFPTFPNNKYTTKYNLLDDMGLYNVTHKESDKHMFIVQSWRNIAITSPYFHNGSVNVLGEAVRVMAKTQLNQDLTQDQVSNIVAFLNTLTGPFPKQTMPILPQTPDSTLLMQYQ